MEKRVWTLPQAVVENFEVNEYIAGCSDTINKYYDFHCDAGGGKWGDVWLGGTVNASGTQISGGTNLTPDGFLSTGYFHACPESHYVKVSEAEGVFSAGYYNAAGYSDKTTGQFVPVMIWRGENSDDVHATANLAVKEQIVTGNKS